MPLTNTSFSAFNGDNLLRNLGDLDDRLIFSYQDLPGEGETLQELTTENRSVLPDNVPGEKPEVGAISREPPALSRGERATFSRFDSFSTFSIGDLGSFSKRLKSGDTNPLSTDSGGGDRGGFPGPLTPHETNFSGIRCSCPACSAPTTANFTSGNTTATDLQPVAATSTLSGDYQIDGILSGYKWGFTWGNRVLSYSFYEDSVFGGSYYGSETGVREVSEGVKTNVRNILNWFGNALNITFQEVTETNTSTYGRLRFMLSNAPSYAYAYYPSSDSLGSVTGDVHLNPNYDRLGDLNGFQNAAGSHGYLSLIHEIGHALGLKHSFESPALPTGEDNFTNTVMTYTFSTGSPATLMRYDLKALQYLYGANTSYNSGDTVYQFTGKGDRYSIGGQATFNSFFDSIKQLIWDGGGRDTLDFSGLAASSSGYRLNLTPGAIIAERSAYNSTNDTFTFGTEIGYNVLIEDAINSGSGDDIFLNSVANTVGGYTAGRVVGADTIWNATDVDILDLAGYSSAAVTLTQNGSDLAIGLGGNGSVTVKNYYAGSNLQIRYNDTIVLPTISINDISLTEGNSGIQNAVFTLSLDKAFSGAVTVNFATADGTATAGSDYNAASGTVTFNAGETSKTVSVGAIGDTIVEGNETFTVSLSNATNATIARAIGTATIQNDDAAPPAISINDISLTEGNSGLQNAVFTVSLDQAFSGVVTVNFATADGTAIAGSDYNATSGTVTFNVGETSKNVSVGVIGDTIVEGNETFTLALSDATNATIARAIGTATVQNDDVALPAIRIADVSASEGRSGRTTNFNFAVTLDRSSTQTITVNFATANGTAIAGSDYNATSGTLTFNPGVTSRTITVRAIGDSTIESNETFFVNLSNAVNASIADAQGIGTIVNDDSAKTGPAKTLPIDGTGDPLAGEAAILVGNSGADIFILGDTSGSYYNEGKANGLEREDFASIREFNALEGDVIQLYGNALDYRSVTSSGSLPPGTAIYDRANELIGVVEGVTSLDLTSSAFRFVR